MAEQRVATSETRLGYDIFGPLWALALLGAAADADRPEFPFDDAVVEHVRSRRDLLDRFLALVRQIGRFSDAVMDIGESHAPWRGGTSSMTEETLGAYLVMYAGCLEPLPVPLDHPGTVRRLVRMGVDSQLVDLLHGLVVAAAERGEDEAATAQQIVEAMGAVASFAGVTAGGVVADVFRFWRVAYLRQLLRPDSDATPEARTRLRMYARAVEAALRF